MSNQPRRKRVSRRQFLAGLGLTGAGLCVLFYTQGVPAARQYIAENTGAFVPKPDADPNAWLRVLPGGRVQFFVNKMEMGQGIQTALAQIIADELEVRFDQIEAPYVSTAQMPRDSFGTNGSLSVSSLFETLRRAAAEARETLKLEAAKRLGVDAAGLVARDGHIVAAADAGKSIAYGDLVAGGTLVRVLKDKPPLKESAQFRVIGQSVPRIDIPAKVDGSALYGYDASVDGALHGKVARPPTLGAKPGAVKADRARAMNGVQVIVDGDFVGVVAPGEEQAVEALNALEIDWQTGKPLQQADIDNLMSNGAGEPIVIRERGDVNGGLARAARKLSAVYRTPMAAQAPLEMQGALADVRADRAKVWAATQGPSTLQGTIAAAVGLKPEQVEVQPMFLGGGFGRKAFSEAAIEAARLSKAVGRPVRVAWNRAEEFQHGHLRPPTISTFDAALDSAGRISAWDHRQVSGLVLFTAFPAAMRIAFGSDFGAMRGALTDYDFAAQRVTGTLRELPVRTGPWRGLGLSVNTFAVESFVDELAALAGVDPLTFRLAHLGGTPMGVRVAAVLKAAADKAGWGTPLPAGRGRGIACCNDNGTLVAQAAEITFDRAQGRIKVDRIVTALDCGLIVNPRNTEAQIEGNVMWGISSALYEELTIEDGRINAGNFNNYPIASMRDLPQMEHILINRPEIAPSGVGEPPIGPVAAAIANALVAAGGPRIRQLPLTPARILAAQKG